MRRNLIVVALLACPLSALAKPAVKDDATAAVSLYADCLATYQLVDTLAEGKPGMDFSRQKALAVRKFTAASATAGLDDEAKKSTLMLSLDRLLKGGGKDNAQLVEVLASHLVFCDEALAATPTPYAQVGEATTKVLPAANGSQEIRTSWSSGLTSSIIVPGTWSVGRSQPSPGLPSAVTFTAPHDRLKALVTVMPSERGTFTAQSVGETLAEVMREQAMSSTEKKCQIVPIDSPNGMAAYCTLTDAALVGRTELPPGEWLKTTQVFFFAPDGRATVTALSNDVANREFREFVAIISGRFKIQKSTQGQQ